MPCHSVDQLVESHREILACLTAMEPVSPEPRAVRAAAFLRLQRALAQHAAAEEQLIALFAEAVPATEDDATCQTLLHAVEKALIERREWSGEVRSLRSHMQAHVEEEENMILPLVKMMLEEEDSASLDSHVGSSILPVSR